MDRRLKGHHFGFCMFRTNDLHISCHSFCFNISVSDLTCTFQVQCPFATRFWHVKKQTEHKYTSCHVCFDLTRNAFIFCGVGVGIVEAGCVRARTGSFSSSRKRGVLHHYCDHNATALGSGANNVIAVQDAGCYQALSKIVCNGIKIDGVAIKIKHNPYISRHGSCGAGHRRCC